MEPSELKTKAEAWRAADPDPSTAAELAHLLSATDEKSRAELADRFSMALEFGTAGLRGVLGAGPNRMNRAVVRRTTAGLARYLKAQLPEATRRGVVVGRDGRRLSREFADDVASVLAAEGIPALVFPDVVPTPVCAFALKHLNAAGAVMVTASHNPPEYNGYKVYWGNGAQIVPPHDTGIAQAIEEVEPANRVRLMAPEEAKQKGLWRELGEEVGRAYLEAILAQRVHKRDGGLLTIVYSAMHGVGGRWALESLRAAGFTHVHPVERQLHPDGAFPTVRFPNPEEPGAMDLSSALAEEVKADLVLANDPDADRLAVMARDAEGRLQMLTGNEVGVLLGHYLLTHARREGQTPAVLTTIVSSPQLGDIARALNARYDETLTGFKWIANRALQLEEEGSHFLFGYEEALGYTVDAVVRDKDGVGAALVFADLAAWCAGRGGSVLGYLEDIRRQYGLYVASQKNFTLPGAEGLATIARIMDAFRAHPPTRVGSLAVRAVKDYARGERLPPSNVLAYELEGGARITLRPSGTEPKIKYYFDYRETLAPGEPMASAALRAQQRLVALQDAFIALARERGQP